MQKVSWWAANKLPTFFIVFLFDTGTIKSYIGRRLWIRLFNGSFASAIDQICEEKGISKEKVMETIEVAIAAAYKKDFGHKGQNIRASFDLISGAVRIFQVKQVLDESMIKTEEEIEAEKNEERDEREQQREGEEDGEKKVRFNLEKHILIEAISS
ncbi:MAG: hypothetical protein NTV20_01225 [Candidatus Shapirobacteria bacterium]|nr:hypothetical protein [Candidatus Shapirobacteria bacterium]